MISDYISYRHLTFSLSLHSVGPPLLFITFIQHSPKSVPAIPLGSPTDRPVADSLPYLLYLPYPFILYELISGCTYLYLRLHFSHCTALSLCSSLIQYWLVFSVDGLFPYVCI